MQKWKKIRNIVCIQILAIVAILASPQNSSAQISQADTPQNESGISQPTYTVVSCNDGDTCKLKAPDNAQIKVRLVGIDAPESAMNRGKKKKEGQPGAQEAKSYLNTLLVGKTVTLRGYGTDMYGRNLAEIVINNESANLKMVTEGWAEVYRGKAPTNLDINSFESAENEARKAKRGIWSMPGYESPKSWRKRQRN